MLKKWFLNIDDVIASIVLIGVVLVTIVNVIFRFIFNSPILWAEEVAIAFYVWLVFVGASSTMKRDGHIGIDFFVEKMPYGVRKILKYVRLFVMYFVIIYVFIYLGIKLTAQAGLKITPALGISYQWIDVAVPIGGVFLLYHFTRNVKKSFQNNQTEKGDI